MAGPETPPRGAGPPGAPEPPAAGHPSGARGPSGSASGRVRRARFRAAVLRPPAFVAALHAAVGVPLTGAAFRATARVPAPAVLPRRRAR